MKHIFIKWFVITAALVLAGCPGFTGTGDGPFVPVSGISGVPDAATVGQDLDLAGIVEPTAATNRTIAWSVNNAGTTGAAIAGSTLTTTGEGTLVVTARIAGGLTDSADYEQNFQIAVTLGPRQALTAAINAANAAKTGVAASADGADVSADALWATPAAFAALNTAIGAAETAAQNPNAAQTELNAAASALQEATEAFNAAKSAGTKPPPADPADKTALNNAIAVANAAKTGVELSADGTDVLADAYWVSQIVLDTFNQAIGAAETTAQNPAATQAEADAAATALTQAASAFNAAKRRGTKPVTLRTVSLPGGLSFNLRSVSPPGPGGFKWDSGVSSVTTIARRYWMGETEVTQELFQAVMGTNPSYFKSAPASGEEQNKRPVESINWYAALAFCNKLSLLDGKTPVYSVKIAGVEVDWANLTYDAIPVPTTGVVNKDWDNAVRRNANGYRLPYEVEWMWAAMGGTEGGATVTTNGHAKPFAGSDGTNGIGDYAWHANNAANKTHQAGKKLPNELGLYDMTGNVAEWCFEPEGTPPLARHSTPEEPAKMFRGGGWSSTLAVCAVGHRGEEHDHPSKRLRYVGLRLVCDQ
jgi:formylglycine-generating enzyme required for sulfatase activity